MRTRSCMTRRRASSSRVCSARRARSSTAAMYARRLRVASPAARPTAVHSRMPMLWSCHSESPTTTASTRYIVSAATPVIWRAVVRGTFKASV